MIRFSDLLHIFFVIAAVIPAMPAHAREELSLSRIGVERGLSNNHVVGIAQDKQGFIWIATDEGLNRFDGHNFKTYYKDELSGRKSITGNELNCIIDDPARPVVWIGTARAGLNAYDYSADRFISYRHDGKAGSIATDDVTALAPASDGGLWIGTYWCGVDHLDPETGKFTHFNSSTVKGMPRGAVTSVIDGGDGYLYVAHERHGLSIIDIAGKTARNFMPGDSGDGSIPSANLQCVYQDSLSNIWIGSDKGLALFNRDDESFTDFSASHPCLRHTVADIRQASDRRLWLAMELGGLACMDIADSIFSSPEKATLTSIPAGNGHGMLSSPSIRCLYQDSFSNIWAGSWGGGINLLSPNVPAFGLFRPLPDFSEGVTSQSSVFAVIFDDSHNLWIGRDGGGLEVYGTGGRLASYSSGEAGLPGDIVQTAYKDPDGNLWFGFFHNGAARYNSATRSFENIFPENRYTDVRAIASDASGRLLIGASDGMWSYDPSTRKISGPVMVGNGFVRKVFPLDDGKMLIGTFGSGLFVADSAFRELSHLDVGWGIPSNTINDIFRSRDGTIWVATGEGLLKFPSILDHPRKFTLYNRASGLDNSHVTAIAQDRAGNIWVSTNGGISCVSAGRVLNYSHRDHIPLGNFLPNSVAVDQQGNLYFGGISGLCVFNPLKVLEKTQGPAAVITELTVFNPAVNSSDRPVAIQLAGKREVRLNPGQNSFDISFTIGNYAIAREVEYAYMLEGFDSHWIMARDGNTAVFRDIPAGKYVFKVKTRLRNQEWGTAAEMEIVLPPPFWLSVWAKIIYVALALGIVGVLLYFYRKPVNAEALLRSEKERHLREQELNDEKLRFYTNITHELRTPLTLIVGPLEDIVNSDRLSDKEQKSIEMVHRNAERLLDLVNRILEFRKTETQNRRLCVRRGNIAATVYEVALKYKELNRNPKVKVNVSTQSGIMETLYDKEVVTVILDNLISNALKYTAKGSIDVDCVRDGDDMRITVADTGMGISPSALPHIFERYYQENGPHQAAGTGIGLSLVRNLVTLHHGAISVESDEGAGSRFIFTIPAEGSYPEALHTEEEPEKEAEKPAEGGAKGAPADDGKPLVLVVEDNADIRDYIRQSFTDLYDVRCAENGKEGLEMALETIPAIVVSDIMMPVMDGVEMTRRLKGDIRTSHIPVILLTAKAGESDREEGYESGADSYLIKPFSSSLLQSRINNLLIQRMKLTESFTSRPAPAPETNGESLEQKKAMLMEGLDRVDKEFVEKLTKIITDNIPAENVDVNFLASTLCMSASTLYRKVKAITGLSPNEYIRKTKMEMAEKLLLDGHYTLSEIAYKIGMNSIPYFRQCFKDEFGMTPSEYLRRLRH